MSSVEVTPISLPRDTVRFVKTWFPIYENDPHWVPPLFYERKRFFDPGKNPYFKVADVQCFIASQDGRDVGTISAVVDHVYQEEEAGTGFFGFFEFIDDVAVAKALLDAAREWLADKGMKRVIGPFNFNSNHEFGLLVDGFDSDPYVANPHNSAYYPAIYEALGLRQVMDWYGYYVDWRMPGVQRMKRVGERLLARHPEITIRPIDLSRFDEEKMKLREIYKDAWEQNWGHVRLTDAEFDFIAAGLFYRGGAAGSRRPRPLFDRRSRRAHGRDCRDVARHEPGREEDEWPNLSLWLVASLDAQAHDQPGSCVHARRGPGIPITPARGRPLRPIV